MRQLNRIQQSESDEAEVIELDDDSMEEDDPKPKKTNRAAVLCVIIAESGS